MQELPADLADMYRRDGLSAALDNLETAGQRTNDISVRVSDADRLELLNRALLSAARALDARVTGEFKLLPVLQRGLTDYNQIASVARQLPRRLIETSNMLAELNAQLESLAVEVDAEAAGPITALDEAVRALDEVSSG